MYRNFLNQTPTIIMYLIHSSVNSTSISVKLYILRVSLFWAWYRLRTRRFLLDHHAITYMRAFLMVDFSFSNSMALELFTTFTVFVSSVSAVIPLVKNRSPRILRGFHSRNNLVLCRLIAFGVLVNGLLVSCGFDGISFYGVLELSTLIASMWIALVLPRRRCRFPMSVFNFTTPFFSELENGTVLPVFG